MTSSAEQPRRAELPDAASLSVVIPTYNDVDRLADALDSIVGQTLPPAEIVVSDDGSDDGTEEFVRDFAERRAQGVEVRYVRLPSRSGDAAARNGGIEASRGEWIAICDSDDVWAPAKLERQLDFIRHWNGNRPIALLGAHGYNMNDAKKILSPAAIGPTSEADYEKVLRNGGLFYVIHSSAMFSRASYEAAGRYRPSDYGAANEFDFFSRLGDLGVVINLPEPLVYYRKRAGSMQLDRFWERRQNILRLRENQRRRIAGQAPIGREEFEAQLARASAWRRLMRRKLGLGQLYYRRGATDMANGRRVRGAFELLLAAILDGPRFRAGVRNVLRLRRPGGRGRGRTGAPDPERAS